MHPVRFRTVTGTSLLLTASITQSRTPWKRKGKRRGCGDKKKVTGEFSPLSPSGSACQVDTSDCYPNSTDHETRPITYPRPKRGEVSRRRAHTHAVANCVLQAISLVFIEPEREIAVCDMPVFTESRRGRNQEDLGNLNPSTKELNKPEHGTPIKGRCLRTGGGQIFWWRLVVVLLAR